MQPGLTLLDFAQFQQESYLRYVHGLYFGATGKEHLGMSDDADDHSLRFFKEHENDFMSIFQDLNGSFWKPF